MKLTITIEEDKEGEVRIDRPGGTSVIPADDRPADVAATSAGGPPESLLAELEERPQTQVTTTETGEVLDAGTLQSVVRMHEWSPAAIRRLNGEQLVVASRSQDQEKQEFAVLDPKTYEVVHSWTIHGTAEWFVEPSW